MKLKWRTSEVLVVEESSALLKMMSILACAVPLLDVYRLRWRPDLWIVDSCLVVAVAAYSLFWLPARQRFIFDRRLRLVSWKYESVFRNEEGVVGFDDIQGVRVDSRENRTSYGVVLVTRTEEKALTMHPWVGKRRCLLAAALINSCFKPLDT